MILEYGQWYRKHGDDYKSVGWNKPKHEIRFSALIKNWRELSKSKASNRQKYQILDLGCGLAHLNDYLIKKNINVEYTGLDINNQFIEINSKKFPNQNFMVGAADGVIPSHDFIFASGLFNRKFSDSEKFFRNTVKNIIEASRIGCSFNCLSTIARKKYVGNYYISMEQIEAILDRDLIEYFNIDGESIPGEVTVHIKKVAMK